MAKREYKEVRQKQHHLGLARILIRLHVSRFQNAEAYISVVVIVLLDIKPTQQKFNKQSLAFGQCIIYFVADVNILIGENLQDTHLFVQNFVNCVEIFLFPKSTFWKF